MAFLGLPRGLGRDGDRHIKYVGIPISPTTKMAPNATNAAFSGESKNEELSSAVPVPWLPELAAGCGVDDGDGTTKLSPVMDHDSATLPLAAPNPSTMMKYWPAAGVFTATRPHPVVVPKSTCSTSPLDSRGVGHDVSSHTTDENAVPVLHVSTTSCVTPDGTASVKKSSPDCCPKCDGALAVVVNKDPVNPFKPVMVSCVSQLSPTTPHPHSHHPSRHVPMPQSRVHSLGLHSDNPASGSAPIFEKCANRLGVSRLLSRTMPSVATQSTACLISADVAVGVICSMRATMPVTYGVAKLVPSTSRLPDGGDAKSAAVTSSPGAYKSTHDPQLLNVARRSLLSVAATVMALPADAGDS